MVRSKAESSTDKRRRNQTRLTRNMAPGSNCSGLGKKAQGGVRKKLKKENAGGRQNGAGKKKSSAENEGDAVLSSLETNEGNRGKNKGEKPADDLQVALKNGIGLQLNSAKPISGENHKEKDTEMRQKDRGVAATALERGFAHGVAELSSNLPGRTPT